MPFKPSNRNKQTEVKEKDKLQLPEIEVTQLPSNFKTYGDKKISFSPYTFGDVNRLNQSKLSEETKIDRILEGIKCDFDPYDLTFADYLYINLLRKISTFGSKQFKASFKCSLCKSINSIQTTENNLEFDELEVEMPITATLKNGTELVFSPLTVRNYIDLINKGLEENRVAALSTQVTNMPYDKSYDIIDKAVGDDSDVLEEVDNLLYHGLSSMNIKCNNEDCGSNIRVALDGGQVIIYPFREHTFNPRDALRFGVQKSS